MRVELTGENEDLHLVVNDERADRAAVGAPRRNVYQRHLPGRDEPYPLLVRVVNVAREAAESTERPYELEITLDEVRACEAGVMATAVNRRKMASNLIPRHRFLDQWSFSEHRPGVSTLELSGVVSDGGTACSGHVSALTARGAAAVGQISEEEAEDRRAESITNMADEAEEMSDDPDAGEAGASGIPSTAVMRVSADGTGTRRRPSPSGFRKRRPAN